jgi:hypothetical protein
MEEIRVKMPLITTEQKKIIMKALNYYRLCGVEFAYATDDMIFNATNLMEIIEINSKLIKVGEE